MYIDPYQLTDIEVQGYGTFSADELNGDFQILEQCAEDVYLIRCNHRQFRIRILEMDPQKGHYNLKINGADFDCKVNTRLSHLIRELGFNEKSKDVLGHIVAPMPGLVLSIMIEPGMHVEEGHNLLILEAMKMENIIKAPQSGIVEMIHIDKGDKVDKGQLLIQFGN
ncbi:MAG TPA: acetyl-CoA carboxylase biotin carboxyl carrier protein subunit [Saprospiraceae bacterium]|nr:acetyl-CoA carboxylase biotin carboxyl carrier protein subunit [Saprospiraceae bacterium]